MRAQPSSDFDWVETAAGLALRSRALQRIAEHLFTTRAWLLGSPNGPDSDSDSGWAQVAKAFVIAPAMMTRARQVHGASVCVVRRGKVTDGAVAEADVLTTDDPQRVLAIQTADCVPLLI